MAASSAALAKRRLGWAVLTFGNLASAWLPMALPHAESYWMVGLGISVASIPMLYRSEVTTGYRVWLPVAVGVLLMVTAIALLL